jgi:hypothetical protein
MQSDLALSIIIVGVGSADFASMDRLDADDAPLRCPRTGRVQARDIVQVGGWAGALPPVWRPVA